MKPEEIVRQNLIHEMVAHYGYPRELIGVEREISTLPHLQGKKIPKRRFDLICFTGLIHKEFSLYPLLLVECKAVTLTEATFAQVLGYNYHVGAYFVAIANSHGVVLVDKNGEMVSEGIVPYRELVALGLDLAKKSVSCV